MQLKKGAKKLTVYNENSQLILFDIFAFLFQFHPLSLFMVTIGIYTIVRIKSKSISIITENMLLFESDQVYLIYTI